MGPNRTKNLLSNLTWKIPVDSEFNYLVRLHFCEIQPEITRVGERPFIIYMDNKIADDRADVLLWSGRSKTPVYKDYVVRIQNNDDLFVALHPRGASFAIDDAILNGMEVFKLSNPDGNLAVAGPDPETLPSPPAAQQSASIASEPKKKKTIIIIAIGSGAGFLFVLTLVCYMLLWKLRKAKRYASYYPLSKCWCDNRKSTSRTRASSLPEELCRHFSLDEIKTATHNFHEDSIIGVGGFGNVYKGLIDNSTMTVAIKRLNLESVQCLGEFWIEIKKLSLLRHAHLVSLIGFCNEEDEMILVYDYMTNGTLRHHLYDTHNNPLSWKRRLQICVGAACGLDYLHTGVKQPIVHRDVKTRNIMLDEKLDAKVTDFGLPITGRDNMAVSTFVKGTVGYMDPNYARHQPLTEKFDVYSFGVVLFEVLFARQALDEKVETDEQWHLANWARKCIESGTIGNVIDPYLKGKIAPTCFKLYLEVAESCIRDLANQRPTMNDVMKKLRFALELQENADTAMEEKINSGGEPSYP
jgi:hypothetical protein